MADLQAGAELDRAVGEIVGDPFPRAHDWEYTGLSGYDESVYRCTRCGEIDLDETGGPGYDPADPCVVPYSTDLNAAFAAASKVGLFDRHGSEGCLSQNTMRPVPKWMVCSEDVVGGCKGVIVYGSTPALAICAAILKLAERRPLPYA